MKNSKKWPGNSTAIFVEADMGMSQVQGGQCHGQQQGLTFLLQVQVQGQICWLIGLYEQIIKEVSRVFVLSLFG